MILSARSFSTSSPESPGLSIDPEGSRATTPSRLPRQVISELSFGVGYTETPAAGGVDARGVFSSRSTVESSRISVGIRSSSYFWGFHLASPAAVAASTSPVLPCRVRGPVKACPSTFNVRRGSPPSFGLRERSGAECRSVRLRFTAATSTRWMYALSRSVGQRTINILLVSR